MAKTIKNPSKTIREIITAICIFALAAGAAIAGAVKNNYRWIGVCLIVVSVVALLVCWITYFKSKKAFVKYYNEHVKETQESTCDVEPQRKDIGLTKNFSWIVDVPSIQGSPIQFATDPKLKSALECLETARGDINYVSNLEKYKDIEINNINIYLRQVLEWALKFIKFNDSHFKKWKTYFTIFDGKKIVHDTDFVIDENRNLTTQWTISSHENGVYTYTGKFQTGKMFYAQSYKRLIGRDAMTVWHRDETTGAPFLAKWAKLYPQDHVVALIQDVCLDIYRTTSKIIHGADDSSRITNQIYSKYYKDENVSDKAKALLVAKAMFHQTRYVLWYVANKYSLYEQPFINTDTSVYKAK